VGVIAVARQVQTLLFTDIVGPPLLDCGSWAIPRGRPCWPAQDVIRAVLAAHRGREVDTASDGSLARFDAPAPAVRAAAAAMPAVAALGLELRAGLHCGEVELNGNPGRPRRPVGGQGLPRSTHPGRPAHSIRSSLAAPAYPAAAGPEPGAVPLPSHLVA
jgi:hypothetical protein